MVNGKVEDIHETQPGVEARLTSKFAIDTLNSVNDYSIDQTNLFYEALTVGVCANSYVIGDRTQMVTVNGAPGKAGLKPIPKPVFAVYEDSTCCCRFCCAGHQPLLAHVYPIKEPPKAGNSNCGCYTGHQYIPDVTEGPVFTIQRDGCRFCGPTRKWLGCFICGDSCKDTMSVHAGEVDGKPSARPGEVGYIPKTAVIGTTDQPDNGGCFTPTLLISDGAKELFAVMEGDTCFGGMKEFFCGANFVFSSPGKSKMTGDLGGIYKPRPDGCMETCIYCFTPVDYYQLGLQPEAMQRFTPEQKATLLSTAVQIDYMFFENDRPPIEVEPIDNGVIIWVTLCNMYCAGCVVPICMCFPIQGEG